VQQQEHDQDLGTLELTVTDEMVQHYVKGLDEPNPWYTAASPFGGPVALVIVYQQADSEFKGWYLDNLFGNLCGRAPVIESHPRAPSKRKRLPPPAPAPAGCRSGSRGW
jgi:hypothetical protein